MIRRSLFWKIYPYYFFIILVSLVLTASYGAHEMKSLYRQEMTSTLEARARLVKRVVAPLIEANDLTALTNECQGMATLSSTRITIIGVDGVVLSDSHRDPLVMENHALRPEVLAAAKTEALGVATRYSNTLNTTMMYVAVPIKRSGEVVAIVRAAISVLEVEQTLDSYYRHLLIGGVLILIVAALISLLLIRRLSVPLRTLRDGAGRFAQGELDSQLPIPNTEEIASLAESMNSMARQLNQRINLIADQRNEREAILSSMSEGVLALDADQRIVSLNRVTAKFLRLDLNEAPGRPIYEVVRSTALYEFVDQGMKANETLETELELTGSIGRSLKAYASPLRDSQGERVGLVLVFNDVSRLKKLENIRRDFVANVSHELKTPITAITGAVETLLDSELNEINNPQQFLHMISRHSERLNELVNDLMSLARFDSDAESSRIELAAGSILERLEAAVLNCESLAAAKQVRLVIECDTALIANLNEIHFEQALSNLIDNAIKYSEPGGVVILKASRDGTQLAISISDRGAGIAEEHLPRLFERFYRVDRGRSREIGGTGLGLAIVKHIALAHGGQVGVESHLGQGSTFTIYLPAVK